MKPIWLLSVHVLCSRLQLERTTKVTHASISLSVLMYNLTNLYFYMCVMTCADWLISPGSWLNWYFPDDDDDDDERTHMVLGFRASRLQCPPLSFQSATMGQDCGSDSAQWCHLWFFTPELTVWIWDCCITSHKCLNAIYRTLDKRHILLNPQLLFDLSKRLYFYLDSLSTDFCVCQSSACLKNIWMIKRWHLYLQHRGKGSLILSHTIYC